MKEKITKNRKYILMVLGILILALFNIGMRYLATRPRYKTLPEVRLVNQKEESTKGFAVMVSNESGDGYIEYTNEDGTWPSEEEGYEFKEAKCIDNDGQLVNNAVTFESGKVTLKTNKTIYCTLYFDESAKTTIQLLRKNDPQNKLSSETVGGMYRYQGKNTDTINNYICFGTDNKEECTNESTGYDKYMYRIIGITEDGQLYLIKMKGVEGSENTYRWGENDVTWPNNDVYKRLNGTSANGNPIFINNTRYNYMVEGNPWYNKIENHNWMYGTVSSISNTTLNGKAVYGASNNGLILYDIETGAKATEYTIDHDSYDGPCNPINVSMKWSGDVTAKIGLMYLHDYYLAYDNSKNWYSDYDTSNWIHFVNNKNTTGSSGEWLLSDFGYQDGAPHTGCWGLPGQECRCCGSSSGCEIAGEISIGLAPNTQKNRTFALAEVNNVDSHINDSKVLAAVTIPYYLQSWYVASSGQVAVSSGRSYGLRPTFYLSSTVTIKNGQGTINDPYIIDIGENN